MARRIAGPGGTIVLDSQGLSLMLRDDRGISARIMTALQRSSDVVTSGLTVLEVQHAGLKKSKLDHTLSMLKVVEATREVRSHAGELLRTTGMHGHTHLVDAVVAATALRQPRPTLLYTSDPDDMTRLCDRLEPTRNQVKIVKV